MQNRRLRRMYDSKVLPTFSLTYHSKEFAFSPYLSTFSLNLLNLVPPGLGFEMVCAFCR